MTPAQFSGKDHEAGAISKSDVEVGEVSAHTNSIATASDVGGSKLVEESVLAEGSVLRVSDTGWQCLKDVLNPPGLSLETVADGQAIPGSHWGDEEAGLIQYTLYARLDTPVHSVLHEACHWLMMSDVRRAQLHTDAKGSAVEEMAVCYLQVLLAELMPTVGKQRMFSDMDAWGYSFREGSAQCWFENDASDALAHLSKKLPHAHRIPGLQIRTPRSGVFE